MSLFHTSRIYWFFRCHVTYLFGLSFTYLIPYCAGTRLFENVSYSMCVATLLFQKCSGHLEVSSTRFSPQPLGKFGAIATLRFRRFLATGFALSLDTHKGLLTSGTNEVEAFRKRCKADTFWRTREHTYIGPTPSQPADVEMRAVNYQRQERRWVPGTNFPWDAGWLKSLAEIRSVANFRTLFRLSLSLSLSQHL